MSKSYRSELVGVFGNPIDENPTGVVEEAAFQAFGLDYRIPSLCCIIEIRSIISIPVFPAIINAVP